MNTKILNMMCFGDSNTFGLGVSSGYPDLLKQSICNKRPNDRVYNLGISGDTTKWLLERLNSEIKARFRTDKHNFISFAFGSNDSAYLTELNNYQVNLESFKANLHQALTIVSNYHFEQIYFLEVPTVDEKSITSQEQIRNNHTISKYNQVIQNLCKQHNCVFIQTMMNYQNSFLQADGLHLSTLGQEAVYLQLLNHLQTDFYHKKSSQPES